MSSARRKLGRGVEHVGKLLAEASAFEGREAYAFECEVDRVSSHEQIHRCFAVEREPVPEEWPLLAGEAIQNLRSALDHLIYGASGNNERSQFPIFTDAGAFAKRGQRMVAGVPTQMLEWIEATQPYRVAPQSPDQDLLEGLRVWSNVDKHRTLATLASAVMHESIGVNTGVAIEWEEMATSKVLGAGRTQISQFRARAEREIGPEEVEPRFDYQVALEGRPISILRGIVHRVFKALVECETGEPLSPGAAYPL